MHTYISFQKYSNTFLFSSSLALCAKLTHKTWPTKSVEHFTWQFELLCPTSSDLMTAVFSESCLDWMRVTLSDSSPIFSLWARISSISDSRLFSLRWSWAFSRCNTRTFWESAVFSVVMRLIVVSRSLRRLVTYMEQTPYNSILNMIHIP